jgi:hypothetical protein
MQPIDARRFDLFANQHQAERRRRERWQRWVHSLMWLRWPR